MCPPCRWSRFVTAGAAAGLMCRAGGAPGRRGNIQQPFLPAAVPGSRLSLEDPHSRSQGSENTPQAGGHDSEDADK
jgi:hypothetical protein